MTDKERKIFIEVLVEMAMRGMPHNYVSEWIDRLNSQGLVESSDVSR